MTLLEVCCYSMECALEAQRRGADRIETMRRAAGGRADAFAGRTEIGTWSGDHSRPSDYSPARR